MSRAAKKKVAKKKVAKKKVAKKKVAAKKKPAAKKKLAAKKKVAKKKVAKKKVAKKQATKKKATKKKATKKAATKKAATKKKASKKAATKKPTAPGQFKIRPKLDVPDFILEPFQTRFPIVGDGFSLEVVRITNFEWGGGLGAHCRLRVGKAIEEAQLWLLGTEQMDSNWDEVIDTFDRWCARVRSMSAESIAKLGIEGLEPWAELEPEELERRYVEYLARVRPETPEQTEQRRRAALEQAYAGFPRLAEHVQAVWGLPLPRTLAVYHAFHRAIASFPNAVREASNTWSGGILDRLAPHGWDLQLRPGIDERVHTRFRQDPPEMLSFAWGNSDGLHFGLWYDTAEEAIAVVSNYARDSAETWVTGDHPLSVCRQQWAYDEPPQGETGFGTRLYLEELEWFEAEERRVASNTAGDELARRPALLGGPGSIPVAELPLDIEGRIEAYREDPEVTRGWMAEAREALAAGDPAMALALGRELHWFDHDRYREQAGALLLAAYEALGRTTHAGILRAHLAHRDEPTVDVYEPPPEEGEE
ncbi:MAG TPA: hypothetical protein VM869_23700 [Enhygromyxa sp.]|nr:hypothetical protein [Enhygromyxa sp.]